MKNAINYYYNLYPNNIHQTEKGYYFSINQTRYFLLKYLDEPKEIQKIYNMHLNLLNQKFYIHPIILNTKNQIFKIRHKIACDTGIQCNLKLLRHCCDKI